MEIIVAVLLLFGGFTLGSISADHADVEPPATTGSDGQSITQPVDNDPTRCSFDSGPRYRDLTVPYPGPIHRPERPTGDCAGNCPDE